ncbi:hypothetical protein ACQSSU_25910 [Micromonospora echinospora]
MEGPTEIIPVAPESSPIFVDPSGRRRRWLRRAAYALGLAGVAYTALVGVSFAGGPVRPETIIPFVEPTTRQWQPPPAVEPAAEPTPAVGSSATTATRTPPRRPAATPSSSPSATPSTASPTPATPSPSPSAEGSSGGRPEGTPTRTTSPTPPVTSPSPVPPTPSPQEPIASAEVLAP